LQAVAITHFLHQRERGCPLLYAILMTLSFWRRQAVALSAGVLDGDLDKFMAATLAMDVAGKSRAEANAED